MVIQARTGSRRLPGKSLMRLGEFNLIQWVLMRTLLAARSEDIVLATTTSPNDQQLADCARDFGIKTFRGSETNVLSRFQVISNTFPEYESIVRVCADNPFVSPELLLSTKNYFDQKQMAYCHSLFKPHLFPYVDGLGVEVIQRGMIVRTQELQVNDKEEEHVTLALLKLSLQIDELGMPTPSEYNYPLLKLDIDTQEDYDKIYELVKCYSLTPMSSDATVLGASLDFFEKAKDN